MAVDYRHGLSILEVIIYIPTFFIGLWMAFRHGFSRSAGWIFFSLFSLLQVVGSCCYLATISSPTSKDLYMAWAICTSIGLSPLTQACISLLSRANDSIKRNRGRAINPIIFKLTGTVTLLALILSIVGTTQTTNFIQSMSNGKTQASIILFLIAWVGLCILAALINARREDIEEGEKRLLIAVGLSIPLLLIRLSYSFAWVFGHNSHFNMFTGSETILLVMVVLEQILIVLGCLAIGLTLSKRAPVPSADIDGRESQMSPSEYPMVQPRSHEAPPKGHIGGGFPRRGLIGLLVGLIVDKLNERQHR
ncbi:hypothetical protein FE257_002468 [Aspergillus nanangensis]|uniref:DUF7702 domain-containing protein n=1 Tax=Aspergillus nanangensis TaxID=2582783 RepID=A0AAD4GWM6_ASPNN|nr:hypothetical protein FE257_002468 [Aspergillus nanangensis]